MNGYRRCGICTYTHIHNEIFLSTKKNEIMLFAVTWMDPEIVILSEGSQIEKDRYHMISLIYRIFKNEQINLYTKQRDSRT